TDISNSEEALAFAGWALDDVSITTERPTDDTPPAFAEAPDALMVRPAGQPVPEFVVNVTDDTGVASVRVQYQYFHDGGVTSGTERLAMDFSDIGTFRAALPVPAGAVGDYVEYRYLLRDADGNEVTYPSLLNDPLRIEFRLVETQDVLPMASPTGDWSFANPGWEARPDGGTAV